MKSNPAIRAAEDFVHAGYPVSLHRILLVLCILTSETLDFDNETQEVVLPMSVIHKKGNRPLLLIAAELDVVCPMENYKLLYDKAPEPKKWVVFEKTRHFEFYEGEPADRSAAEAVKFFKEHLNG